MTPFMIFGLIVLGLAILAAGICFYCSCIEGYYEKGRARELLSEKKEQEKEALKRIRIIFERTEEEDRAKAADAEAAKAEVEKTKAAAEKAKEMKKAGTDKGTGGHGEGQDVVDDNNGQPSKMKRHPPATPASDVGLELKGKSKKEEDTAIEIGGEDTNGDAGSVLKVGLKKFPKFNHVTVEVQVHTGAAGPPTPPSEGDDVFEDAEEFLECTVQD